MIEPKDVDKAAQLARLALSDDERTGIVRDLVQIVKHVDELLAADADDAPPMERGPRVEPRTRADVERPVLGRAALEGNPGFDGALVRVPKVIE